MAIGDHAAAAMYGSPGFGNGHPTREPTGVIRTTTILTVAGRCTEAIGTAKTMETTTTTMETMAITTTAIIARPDVPICKEKGLK
jgi:hypothetical protein